ncbi:MAG: LamG-like jellyroll fold domain-containing protein, partial [Candidatus Poribacteria bacterium]
PPSFFARASSVVRKKMDDKTFAFFVDRSDFQVGKVNIGFETCKNGGMACGAVQMDLSDFQFNQWHHLAWTHSHLDGKMSDYSFYIDGIPTLVGRGSSEPDYFTSEGILTVGEGYFNGAIDELRISDEVIYKGQFRAPQRLRPKKSTLALWHFDEPMNSAHYHDASGRSNTLFNSKFSVQPLGQLIFSWGNLKRL